MTESTPKTENIAEAKESGHETRTRVTGFEPEILAFVVSIEPIVQRTWQVR